MPVLSTPSPPNRGFTLIELMIVIAIIGVLSAVVIPLMGDLIRKSKDGSTKGSLGGIRSALSIYYADNELYPYDDASSMTVNGKYLEQIPPCTVVPYHLPSTLPLAESVPTDTGRWSYNNDATSITWGSVVVGCTHTDLQGNIWTSY